MNARLTMLFKLGLAIGGWIGMVMMIANAREENGWFYLGMALVLAAIVPLFIAALDKAFKSN